MLLRRRLWRWLGRHSGGLWVVFWVLLFVVAYGYELRGYTSLLATSPASATPLADPDQVARVVENHLIAHPMLAPGDKLHRIVCGREAGAASAPRLDGLTGDWVVGCALDSSRGTDPTVTRTLKYFTLAPGARDVRDVSDAIALR